ncbi:MAG: FAD-binding oxidoreductase [Armatimonadetes bacterium]|nr:FAD-binding oxidoreductase [Armatimonadota bacterium]
MLDLIVVGGGIVGFATAYQAARMGAKTLVFDRGDLGRATDAGAGVLSPQANHRDPDEWFKIAVEAVAHYDDLFRMLREDGETQTGYARCGELILALDDAEIAEFESAKRILEKRPRDRISSAMEMPREISVAEARKLFPLLGEAKRVLYAQNAARVDGKLVATAIERAAKLRGVEARAESVERVLREESRVLGVATASGEVRARGVIIAGGAWSRAFGQQLGFNIAVEPQRGQIFHVRYGDANTGNWPVVSGFRGTYMVPWPEGRIALGTTRETGSGFDPRVTVGGLQHVLGHATQVAPALANATLIESRVGLRPLSPDLLPILGAVPKVEGAFLVTGHGPTGLTLGPYTGLLAAQLALGRTPERDLAPFRPNRFK